MPQLGGPESPAKLSEEIVEFRKSYLVYLDKDGRFSSSNFFTIQYDSSRYNKLSPELIRLYKPLISQSRKIILVEQEVTVEEAKEVLGSF